MDAADLDTSVGCLQFRFSKLIVGSGHAAPDRSLAALPFSMIQRQPMQTKRFKGQGRNRNGSMQAIPAQRKTPVPPGFFMNAATLSLVMHKQRQQDDDWDWDSNQPKKCTFSKAHICLHQFDGQRRDTTTVPHFEERPISSRGTL
jgi:hypothetical protein